MPHLIHTADWQIGRQFGQFDHDDAAALAVARIETAAAIGEFATRARADMILVAGDVFDSPTISDKTVRRLFKALASYDGPWLLLPGNHDAALATGVWARARELGCVTPNVFIVDTPGVRRFDDLQIAVLAAPLTQRNTLIDLTDVFDRFETPPGMLRIGLAHGSVTGQLHDGAGAGNPIAADRCRSARLDYLALGDWHGAKCIDERTWYSGTPEPDRFRDNEPGTVLSVRIAQAGATPQVTSHRVARYTWHEMKADLQVPSDLPRLIADLAAFGATDVVRLAVSGSLGLDGRRTLDAALAAASATVRALDVDVDGLKLMATDDDLAALQADGYVLEVLDDLRRSDLPLAEPVRREALRLLADLLGDAASTRS